MTQSHVDVMTGQHCCLVIWMMKVTSGTLCIDLRVARVLDYFHMGFPRYLSAEYEQRPLCLWAVLTQVLTHVCHLFCSYLNFLVNRQAFVPNVSVWTFQPITFQQIQLWIPIGFQFGRNIKILSEHGFVIVIILKPLGNHSVYQKCKNMM